MLRLIAVALLAVAMPWPVHAATAGMDQVSRKTFEGRWVLTASPKLSPRCKLPWTGSVSDSDGLVLTFKFARDKIAIWVTDDADYDVPGQVVEVSRDNGNIRFRTVFNKGQHKIIALRARSPGVITLLPSDAPGSSWENPPYFDGGTLLRCNN